MQCSDWSERSRALTGTVLAALILAGSFWSDESRAGAVREFKIVAKKYSFEPDRFEVQQGDHVRFIVTSTDANHGIAIKPLKVKATISKGETGLVEFDATQAGTFDIGCAEWCGKGHKTMHATLVVRSSDDTGSDSARKD
jgi:cytochrome c oxidase subunit 2